MHPLHILSISTDRGFCSYGLVELSEEEKETDIMVPATGEIKQLVKCMLYSACTQIIFG